MISLDSSPDGPVPFVFLSPMPIMMKMDLVGCGEPNLACEGLGEAAGSFRCIRLWVRSFFRIVCVVWG